MRLVVFFDLPVQTVKQRKDYRLFRKYLIKEGYLMMQESVYSKLVVTEAAATSAIERMKKNKPPAGKVQVLKVSEKAFSGMVFIAGREPDYQEEQTLDSLVII